MQNNALKGIFRNASAGGEGQEKTQSLLRKIFSGVERNLDVAITQEISNLLFFCPFLLSLSPPRETLPCGSGTQEEGKAQLLHPAPSPPLSHRRGLSGLEEGPGLLISHSHWRGVQAGAGVSEQEEDRGAVRSSLGILSGL